MSAMRGDDAAIGDNVKNSIILKVCDIRNRWLRSEQHYPGAYARLAPDPRRIALPDREL